MLFASPSYAAAIVLTLEMEYIVSLYRYLFWAANCMQIYRGFLFFISFPVKCNWKFEISAFTIDAWLKFIVQGSRERKVDGLHVCFYNTIPLIGLFCNFFFHTRNMKLVPKTRHLHCKMKISQKFKTSFKFQTFFLLFVQVEVYSVPKINWNI